MSGKHSAHLLVIHRYFWPENLPYATMLKDIVEAVRSDFSEITVASGDPPNRKEGLSSRESWAKANKVNLLRFRTKPIRKRSKLFKIMQMLRYLTWISRILFKTNASMVLIGTTPPIFAAQLVRLIGGIRGFRYIYHCQDIHPESMFFSGVVRSKLLFRWLRAIDEKNVECAWKVITLSNDMKSTLESRKIHAANIKVINNYIFNCEKVVRRQFCDRKVKFLFAGTLGYFQNLEFLIRALTQVKNDMFEVLILGDGPLRKKLELIVNDAKANFIHFRDLVPINEAVSIMHEFDYGIISLSKNVTRYAYPSKSMIYLGNGLPVVGFVDSGTELMSLINDKKLGMAIDPVSEYDVVKTIDLLINEAEEYRERRDEIQRAAHLYFGKNVQLQQLKKEIVGDR